ncbi:MAG: hypothetical protein ACKVQA_26215 [Burkholderiales bacterium]
MIRSNLGTTANNNTSCEIEQTTSTAHTTSRTVQQDPAEQTQHRQQQHLYNQLLRNHESTFESNDQILQQPVSFPTPTTPSLPLESGHVNFIQHQHHSYYYSHNNSSHSQSELHPNLNQPPQAYSLPSHNHNRRIQFNNNVSSGHTVISPNNQEQALEARIQQQQRRGSESESTNVVAAAHTTSGTLNAFENDDEGEEGNFLTSSHKKGSLNQTNQNTKLNATTSSREDDNDDDERRPFLGTASSPLLMTTGTTHTTPRQRKIALSSSSGLNTTTYSQGQIQQQQEQSLLRCSNNVLRNSKLLGSVRQQQQSSMMTMDLRRKGLQETESESYFFGKQQPRNSATSQQQQPRLEDYHIVFRTPLHVPDKNYQGFLLQNNKDDDDCYDVHDSSKDDDSYDDDSNYDYDDDEENTQLLSKNKKTAKLMRRVGIRRIRTKPNSSIAYSSSSSKDMFTQSCCAGVCAGFSFTGFVFLFMIGVLLDTQPLYIGGVLPQQTIMSNNNKAVIKYLIPIKRTKSSNRSSSSNEPMSERLPMATTAYNASLLYVVTFLVSLHFRNPEWLYQKLRYAFALLQQNTCYQRFCFRCIRQIDKLRVSAITTLSLFCSQSNTLFSNIRSRVFRRRRNGPYYRSKTSSYYDDIPDNEHETDSTTAATLLPTYYNNINYDSNKSGYINKIHPSRSSSNSGNVYSYVSATSAQISSFLKSMIGFNQVRPGGGIVGTGNLSTSFVGSNSSLNAATTSNQRLQRQQQRLHRRQNRASLVDPPTSGTKANSSFLPLYRDYNAEQHHGGDAATAASLAAATKATGTSSTADGVTMPHTSSPSSSPLEVMSGGDVTTTTPSGGLGGGDSFYHQAYNDPGVLYRTRGTIQQFLTVRGWWYKPNNTIVGQHRTRYAQEKREV